MKRFLTLVSLLITVFSINLDCKAATITAVTNNGVWQSTSTWDLDRAPECGDTIVIPFLFNVRITKSVNLDAGDPLCSAVKLIISGSLSFGNGAKLRLATGACVVANLGGMVLPSLVGGGASESISIDNDNVWQASQGILVGPASFGCAVLLPVSMVSFSVDGDLESYYLSWQVQQEHNLDFYEVLVSEDANNWESINKQTANGNTSSAQNYQFRYLEEPNGQQLYFRLQATDKNGNVSLLSTAVNEIDLSGLLKENELTVYPNPTNQNELISIAFKAQSENEFSYEIVDFSGKVIHQNMETSVKGKNVILLETKDFIKGNYFVKLKTNEFCTNKKITII